jgi:hypothetical protein
MQISVCWYEGKQGLVIQIHLKVVALVIGFHSGGPVECQERFSWFQFDSLLDAGVRICIEL